MQVPCRLLSKLCTALKYSGDVQISNPPLFGIIAGILVGMSPLGIQLFQSDSPIALHRAAQLPTELRTCLGKSQEAPAHAGILWARCCLLRELYVLALACIRAQTTSHHRPTVSLKTGGVQGQAVSSIYCRWTESSHRGAAADWRRHTRCANRRAGSLALPEGQDTAAGA